MPIDRIAVLAGTDDDPRNDSEVLIRLGIVDQNPMIRIECLNFFDGHPFMQFIAEHLVFSSNERATNDPCQS